MNKDIYDLGVQQYMDMAGHDDDRDENGFIVLRPTAAKADKRSESLTTSIDTLEQKLKQLRTEKQSVEDFRQSDAYKESKKGNKKKKHKKDRDRLIAMVFNNADHEHDNDDEDDEEGYSDLKKKKGTRAKKPSTTLDTTYGKRFSPVVSMLHDTINDFDAIAAEIEEELSSSRGQTRNMYRSTQIGNLISAKNSKLSAVKELGSIAKTVSDLEYKKDKDKKAEEGTDSKIIASLSAKYLRGGLGDYTSGSGKKGKKGKKDKGGKEKGEGQFQKAARKMGYSPSQDDDDDDPGTIDKDGKSRRNRELGNAKEFAKAIAGRSKDIKFTGYEKHLDMEGKYSFVVVCDPLDPEHTWDFMVVDKHGEEIKGFKKEYKELMPKKKSCRMRFDINKKKCVDLNSSKNYRLVFTD